MKAAMPPTTVHRTASEFPAVRRVGFSHEILRRTIGHWQRERGAQRIPRELAKLFASLNSSGVIAGVGARSVLFPFQPGDITHPAYWFLYEKGIRRVLGAY
jgi:hypothetical protein